MARSRQGSARSGLPASNTAGPGRSAFRSSSAGPWRPRADAPRPGACPRRSRSDGSASVGPSAGERNRSLAGPGGPADSRAHRTERGRRPLPWPGTGPRGTPGSSRPAPPAVGSRSVPWVVPGLQGRFRFFQVALQQGGRGLQPAAERQHSHGQQREQGRQGPQQLPHVQLAPVIGDGPAQPPAEAPGRGRPFLDSRGEGDERAHSPFQARRAILRRRAKRCRAITVPPTFRPAPAAAGPGQTAAAPAPAAPASTVRDAARRLEPGRLTAAPSGKVATPGLAARP